MKSNARSLFALASLAAGLVTAGLAAEAAPGYVDFGNLNASAKGEYVEVNLNGSLLRLVSKFAKSEDPAAAELIGNLKSVRVNVVGLDDSNRASTTERVAVVRKELAEKGWEQIVTVRGKHEENVAVFVKHRGEDTIEGLVVTVIDERKHEAVLVNVVGDIKPEQLGALAKHLHIGQLNLGSKTI